MKVIRELIHHFANASVLTPEDLRFLKESGWIGFEPGEAHFNSDGTIVQPVDGPPSDEVAPSAGEPEVSPVPSRKGKGPKPRSTEHSAKKLEGWLESRMEKWRAETEALSHLSPGGLRALRDLPVDAAGDLVFKALEHNPSSSRELWKALLADGYRNWFERRGATGSVTQAFRALLTESSGSDLSRYRWLQRYDCVAEVALLASVQRTLLLGVGNLLQSDPPRVAERVRREKSLPGLFLLVLGEATRRFDLTAQAMPAGDVPLRSLPRPGERRRSLRAVTLMNPSAAIPFLGYCTALWGAEGLKSAENYGTLGLSSPLAWRLGYRAWGITEAVDPPQSLT